MFLLIQIFCYQNSMFSIQFPCIIRKTKTFCMILLTDIAEIIEFYSIVFNMFQHLASWF